MMRAFDTWEEFVKAFKLDKIDVVSKLKKTP